MMQWFYVIAAGLLLALPALAQETEGTPKILIVYFSKTNNTRAVAEQIRARVGGDIFQVTTKTPYPDDYQETTRVARAELDNNARPEPAATIPAEAMKEYDVIFFGYPIWWGTFPMVMAAFLEQYDLSGKTIAPFCTHGGSGLGRSVADLERLCPGATILPGLAVRGNPGSSQDDVAAWLRRIQIAR